MEPTIKVFLAPGQCGPCADLVELGDLQSKIDQTGADILAGVIASVQVIDVMTKEGSVEVERYDLEDVPTAIVEAHGKRQTCDLDIVDGRVQLSCQKGKKVRD